MLRTDNLLQTIKENTENIDTLLILGVGEGRYELELGAKSVFGIDICDEKLEKCKEKAMVAKLDARNLDIFLDKSFDTVTMFDLLEHFKKDVGLNILKELERIAKRQIILFVPLQAELDDTEETLIALQEDCIVNGRDAGYHLSLWTEEELKSLGYETICDPTFHGTFGACLAVKNLVLTTEEKLIINSALKKINEKR